MAFGQDVADYIAKYKNQRKKVREAFNKDEGQRGSVDRKVQDYKGPKAPNFSVPKDSGKIKPAQNKVTPAVSNDIIPSHLRDSNATTHEPKYPLRVTAADKGGLQVKSPTKETPTGNLSTKRIDMHQQARNMIQTATSVEEMNKRRK